MDYSPSDYIRREEPQDLSHHQHSSSRGCGLDHLGAVGLGQRHGLLDQNMLASSKRSQSEGLVEVRRRADVHRFNIGIVNQVLGPLVAGSSAQIDLPAPAVQVSADVAEVA